MYFLKYVWNLLIFDSYMLKVGYLRFKWLFLLEDVLFGFYFELMRKWDNWINCVVFKVNVKGGWILFD